MKIDQPYVIANEPPAPVREVPPQIVPTSQNYQWINGYWGWEPEENRFVWISGIWRQAPDDLVWNPGYWTQVNQGYAWVSGFWSSEADRHFPIAEAPPEPRQEEPGEAPSADHFWVPGVWQYARDGYQWEPGYWARGYDGRVWVPFHYSWTPRGYIAVNGYWDYDLEDRGVLFSPVVFQQGYQSNIQYSPSVVVRVNYLPTHLFVNAPYGHYVYGDYYGVQRAGFYAWTSSRVNFYDPLRVFFQIHAPDRYARYRDRHVYYRDHADLRPRHSWKEQRDFQASKNVDLGDSLISTEINTLVQQNSNNTHIQFKNDEQTWNDVVQQSNEIRARQQKRESYSRDQDQRFQKGSSEYKQQREDYLRDLEKRRDEQVRAVEKKAKELGTDAKDSAQGGLREADRRRQELQQKSPQRDAADSAVKQIPGLTPGPQTRTPGPKSTPEMKRPTPSPQATPGPKSPMPNPQAAPGPKSPTPSPQATPGPKSPTPSPQAAPGPKSPTPGPAAPKGNGKGSAQPKGASPQAAVGNGNGKAKGNNGNGQGGKPGKGK